jgi:dolichol-phosphate mannosyltransferase
MFALESDVVRVAIIIPSYRELLALPTLLKELSKKLRTEDVIIIIDDSPYDESKMIKKRCIESFETSLNQLIFVNSGTKSGRGHAVRRGMSIARDHFKNLNYVIECDADGSHRTQDIIKLRDSEEHADLLIGSRYLPGSEIQGWPLSRRVFSSLLNLLIPSLLSVKISDITNGLRRYSAGALAEILAAPQKNTGFIYLSEQALVIQRSNLRIAETPITFINRIEGQSTVTIHEVIQSLRGIQKIISQNRK